jgi:hypothetical protein
LGGTGTSAQSRVAGWISRCGELDGLAPMTGRHRPNGATAIVTQETCFYGPNPSRIQLEGVTRRIVYGFLFIRRRPRACKCGRRHASRRC